MPVTTSDGRLTFGAGQPKIAVPIVATTPAAAWQAFTQLPLDQIDLVEWRLDCLSDPLDTAAIVPIAQRMHAQIPLLATIRTQAEGGQWAPTPAQYRTVYQSLLAAPAVDLLDLEAALPAQLVQPLRQQAQQQGVKIIASYHNFTATPAAPELAAINARLAATGADLIKWAVMPQSATDVLTVLGAINAYHGPQPLIAMAMGDWGKVTRLTGGIFPSAITFATAGAASAPGQLTVGAVRATLALLERKG